ncbi:MAG: gluconokinase [Bradyrhizobiaceae bacterium]|nr:MAG: gluconokinase [Bradyrhizobiaceae bacterium]
MGVSGSGKSTIAEALAQRLGFAEEDGDLYHPAANVKKMQSGTPLTDEDRWPWLNAIAALIDRYDRERRGVVIACSALKRAYRDVLVREHSNVRIVYLKGSRELILSRSEHRKGHFMPPSLLNSQFETLEEPSPDEHAIIADIAAPVDAIVVGIIRQLKVAVTEAKPA